MSEKIFELKQKINKLIEERPEYKQFQLDLETRLKNAGSSHNRMILLKMLMSENVLKLQEAVLDLKTSVQKAHHNNSSDIE